MSTIREHLEAIAAGHIDGKPLPWILEATERAVYALEILEEAEKHLRMVKIGIAFTLASAGFDSARASVRKVQPDLEATLALLFATEQT